MTYAGLHIYFIPLIANRRNKYVLFGGVCCGRCWFVAVEWITHRWKRMYKDYKA